MKTSTTANNFIAHWRHFRLMSLDDAAVATGLEPSLIRALEDGSAFYDQRNLEALAKGYGCSPVNLLAADPQKVTTSDTRQFAADLRRLAKGIDPSRALVLRKLMMVALQLHETIDT